jgi:hypothetical protein
MAVNVSNIVVGEATLKLGDSANATSITAMDSFTEMLQESFSRKLRSWSRRPWLKAH